MVPSLPLGRKRRAHAPYCAGAEAMQDLISGREGPGPCRADSSAATRQFLTFVKQAAR
jgi:hypothetical protein